MCVCVCVRGSLEEEFANLCLVVKGAFKIELFSDDSCTNGDGEIAPLFVGRCKDISKYHWVVDLSDDKATIQGVLMGPG